jgi:transcriptional regulator with XRE-family HTH domain
MSIDPEFLAAVQKAGWRIVAVDGSAAFCSCRRDGCGLTVRLAQGAAFPETSRPKPDIAEQVVASFDDARRFLREKREHLCLTIPDVEAGAGIASDFLAKFEKDDPVKIPNAQTFIEWASSLGFQLVLRPGDIPRNMLRMIADTRDGVRRRRHRTAHFRRLRAEKGE